MLGLVRVELVAISVMALWVSVCVCGFAVSESSRLIKKAGVCKTRRGLEPYRLSLNQGVLHQQTREREREKE